MAEAQICGCNVVGNFYPILFGNLGFISVSLRTNVPIMRTSDGCTLLGSVRGELSVSAYGSMNNSLYSNMFKCPGRAGSSYDWMDRYNCLADKVFYIPRGGTKSYIEGDIGVGVTTDISLNKIVEYNSVQASASSGPTTVYLDVTHVDGYGFVYLGGPIQVYDRMINVIDSDGSFLPMNDSSYYGILGELLPENSELFLNSFSWEQTPPDLSIVSYSFVFTLGDYSYLGDILSSIECGGENISI